MDKSTLSSLASFPDQLLHFYEAVPAAYKHWSPPSWGGIPSEAFTAIEQLCHVRDIEIDGYQVRFQRALNEVNPPLESLDGYRFAKDRDYASSNAAEVIADFRTARAKTIAISVEPDPRTTQPHRAIRGVRLSDSAQPGTLPLQP
jgi:hypothetical protein